MRNAIHEFDEKGSESLTPGSSRLNEEVHPAFDEEGAEAWRELLHHPPREEFGKRTSLRTLEDAAQVSFEQGFTRKRVPGETIRATLAGLGGVRWERAKRWIESTNPEYERTKRPSGG